MIDLPATCLTHPEYPWARASLDGFNPGAQKLLEIKCPGKKTMDMAADGEVPVHYGYQIQWQLWIAEAWMEQEGYNVSRLHCDYLAFDGEKGEVVRVNPARDIQAILFERCRDFWINNVISGQSPSLEKGDTLKITQADIVNDAETLMEAITLLESTEELIDEIKQKLEPFITHNRVECGNVRILKRTLKSGKITFTYKRIGENGG